MELVHRLDRRNIRDFQVGIQKDDYDFYDDYIGVREVLIIGSSNSGKSTLLNELNNGKEIAKTSKRSGKTQSLNFYLCNKSWKASKKLKIKHKDDITVITQQGMVIDSPGYGYSYVPVKVKRQLA